MVIHFVFLIIVCSNFISNFFSHPMKFSLAILFFTLMVFTGINCSKNADLSNDLLTTEQGIAKANAACGSAKQDQSLQWLKDIIVKAEEDKQSMKHKGNYLGRIFLSSYHEKPVFYIKMTMGSGGLYFYAFDCKGIAVKFDSNDEMLAFSQYGQKGTLIYSNVPVN